MTLLAIDPGTTESGYVLLTGSQVIFAAKVPNDEMLEQVRQHHLIASNELAIEMIASYGMSVGAEIFETCVWIGRFIEAFGRPATRITRGQVKRHVCGSSKAKDGNVRQALIDLYPPTGGGKTPQIGTKTKPGPLYGLAGDMWQALGVAVTFLGIEAA